MKFESLSQNPSPLDNIRQEARILQEDISSAQEIDLDNIPVGLELSPIAGRILSDREAWHNYRGQHIPTQIEIHLQIPFEFSNEFQKADVEWYKGIPVLVVSDKCFKEDMHADASGTYVSGFYDFVRGRQMPVIFLNRDEIDAWDVVIPSRDEYKKSIIEHEYAHYIHEKYLQTKGVDGFKRGKIYQTVKDCLERSEIEGIPFDDIRTYVELQTLDEIRADFSESITSTRDGTKRVNTSGLGEYILNPYTQNYNYLRNLLGRDIYREMLKSDEILDTIFEIEEEYSRNLRRLTHTIEEIYRFSLIAGQWDNKWSTEEIKIVVNHLLLTALSIEEANDTIRRVFLSPDHRVNQLLLALLSTGEAKDRELINTILNQPPSQWRGLLVEGLKRTA